MNIITIHGRVGSDPELRFSKAGKAVAEFSIADTYGKDDNKEVTWHDIVVFGQIAENICASIQKGDTVMVMGRYKQDEYQKKDGTKGKTKKVIAEEVAASLRWNPWVKDRSEQVMSSVPKVGRPMPTTIDEDESPF